MRPDLYGKYLESPGPIRASLDIVSEAGTVEGWALYTDSLAVCHVQVRLGGVVLGEDMADKFRADLLSAGLRHGHCAFYAAVPITRPGTYPLELVDGRTGRRVDHMGSRETFVPALARKPDRGPSHAASPRATWTDEQVLAHLSCLQLDMNFERMGAERFVDAVFRFALGRWADPSALDSYGAALCTTNVTPTMVLTAVMTSEERKNQNRKLPNLFDQDFPFDCDPKM